MGIRKLLKPPSIPLQFLSHLPRLGELVVLKLAPLDNTNCLCGRLPRSRFSRLLRRSILLLLCRRRRRCRLAVLADVPNDRDRMSQIRRRYSLLQAPLHGRHELVVGTVPVLEVRHQREPLPRLAIAQIRSGTPLAEDLRVKVQCVRTMRLASVVEHLLGRFELAPLTASPIAHKRPVDIHAVVIGGTHRGRLNRSGGRGYRNRAVTGHNRRKASCDLGRGRGNR